MPDSFSGSSRRRVQRAVEEFIRLHEGGRAPDPQVWAQKHDPELRPAILEQCRAYLDMLPALKPPVARAGVPPGSRLGRWRLQEELGRGGMAVVYRAVDEEQARTVALKVLHPALAASLVSETRFQREAEAAGRLEHPHIVRIHEAGSVDGWLYTAMDLVEGESLDRCLDALRLQSPRPDPRELQDLALRIGRQIGSALEHAHSRGVIHRDLKPQNILLDRKGDASLADFGIAMVRDGRDLTLTGQLLGTPYYMSPEQALARRVRQDHRTDLFSLGVVLYEILSLERPFDGPTSDQVLYAISFERPASLRSRVPGLPRDFETVVLKCLEKRPEDRYRSAGELVADLDRIARRQRIRGRRPGAASRLGRRIRTHPWSAAALLVGAAGLAVLGRSLLAPPVDAASSRAGRPFREVVRVDFELGVPEEDSWADLRITAFPFDPFTERRRPGFLLGHGEVHDAALPPGDYWIRYELPGRLVRTDLRILPKGDTRETLRLYLDRPPLDPEAEGMVWIPPGAATFTHRMVADEGAPAALPREVRAQVEGFWIDRTEVSNGQYLTYVQATGAPLPRGWPRPGSRDWRELPENFLHLPVVGVSWREAADFAAWKGKRLPTLGEWLRAAQGPRGWPWPWGPRWEPPDGGDPWERVNIVRERPAEAVDPWTAYLRHVRPVNQPMRASSGPAPKGAGGSFGLLHVLGNVWELTASRALAEENGEPVPFGEQVIIAGYSWRSWLEMSEPQLEGLDAYGDLGMQDRDFSVGFRCVANGRPPRR